MTVTTVFGTMNESSYLLKRLRRELMVQRATGCVDCSLGTVATGWALPRHQTQKVSSPCLLVQRNKRLLMGVASVLQALVPGALAVACLGLQHRPSSSPLLAKPHIASKLNRAPAALLV